MIVFTSLNRHFILQAPNHFREFPKTFTTTSEFFIHSGLADHNDVNFIWIDHFKASVFDFTSEDDDSVLSEFGNSSSLRNCLIP